MARAKASLVISGKVSQLQALPQSSAVGDFIDIDLEMVTALLMGEEIAA